MTQDDLARYLSGGLKGDQVHALDKFTHNVIMGIIGKFIIPWFSYVIQTYPESYFHMKMIDPNWDFILDWKSNHPEKYGKMIKYAHKFRHRFFFDVDEILDRVVGSIRSQAGWQLYDHEILKIRDTIERVRQDIYS